MRQNVGLSVSPLLPAVCSLYSRQPTTTNLFGQMAPSGLPSTSTSTIAAAIVDQVIKPSSTPQKSCSAKERDVVPGAESKNETGECRSLRGSASAAQHPPDNCTRYRRRDKEFQHERHTNCKRRCSYLPLGHVDQRRPHLGQDKRGSRMTVTTPNIAGAAQGRAGNDARSASYDRWTATPPKAATTTPIGRMNQMGTIQRWWSTRKVSRPARPTCRPDKAVDRFAV